MRLPRIFLRVITIVVLTLFYIGVLLLALVDSPGPSATLNRVFFVAELALVHIDLAVFVVGFIFSLLIAYWVVRGILSRYDQVLYDLPHDEAWELSQRLTDGAPKKEPKAPMLRVYDGQVDLDGPPALLGVGGPGYLSVAPNNVAVMQRLGRLHRVLGPGFYPLEAFEKVWDVIDLRPQRRRVTVEFMTRDGIPASCQASIVCRVKPPASPKPHPYDETTVLNLAAKKYVKSLEGHDRISSWMVGITRGSMDGAVRDVLERYSMDEFLNPQYWEPLRTAAGSQALAVLGSGTSASRPRTMAELEAEIEADVKVEGEKRGIRVDKIELGPVVPDPGAISQQWLEYWQARLQRVVDSYNLSATAEKVRLEEMARVEAQVSLISAMVDEVQKLPSYGVQGIPAELILMSFMNVVDSMTERSPAVQQMMFAQAESLLRIVDTIRQRFSGGGTGAPSLPTP